MIIMERYCRECTSTGQCDYLVNKKEIESRVEKKSDAIAAVKPINRLEKDAINRRCPNTPNYRSNGFWQKVDRFIEGSTN